MIADTSVSLMTPREHGSVALSSQGGLRALFNHRYKLRVDNPSIGGDQPKAVNAGSRYDCPVGGVVERTAQVRHLSSDFDIKGDNPQSGICVDGGENFLSGRAMPSCTFAEERCDLKQRDGADGERCAALDRGRNPINLKCRRSAVRPGRVPCPSTYPRTSETASEPVRPWQWGGPAW